MNNFEFWKDMDKIYDAIVAYQEKNIEFNKRFINPWVTLGNVFEKEDTRASIAAHKNAIEIDPESAQNWYELAEAYIRSGSFDESIQAYQEAVKLGFESENLYKNMGLAYAMTARHQMAIPFFERALELSENEKDKAVIWNHLGNVYRKMNNYEQALEAFQRADQLENTETSNSEQSPKVENKEEIPDITNAREEDIAASKTDDDSAAVMEDDSSPGETEGFIDNVDLEAEQEIDHEDMESEDQLADSSSDDVDISFKDEYETWEESQDHDEVDNKPVILEMDFTEKSFEEVSKKEGFKEQADTNLSSVVEDTDEPAILELQQEKHETGEVFSDKKPVEDLLPASDSEEIPASKESPQENLEIEKNSFENESGSEPFLASDEEETPVAVDTGQKEDEIDETVPVKESVSETRTALEESVDGGINNQFLEGTQEIGNDEKSIESKLDIDNTVTHSFYDAFLSEENKPFNENAVANQLEEGHRMAPVKGELTETKMYLDDERTDTDQTVDMDTKNAHVWNELGNVYFTAGSYDDAIAAYSKAIELDTQFAWPYTNLASTYVKKERFKEAILLYQRSIELFSNENDKAVTWNRLGDVYRRLDDYENAIAAYQRADDLDPGNTTITNQTKFSLLGSEKIKQEVSYSL